MGKRHFSSIIKLAWVKLTPQVQEATGIYRLLSIAYIKQWVLTNYEKELDLILITLREIFAREG